jgi:uncharacterized Zn finger protein
MDDFGSFRWRPYVSVADRRQQAEAEIARQRKKGVALNPVRPEGRRIAESFWGKAWCDHLEQYHDYENRLPRGRSYLRNGSVIDLRIEAGAVTAKVQGSSLYVVTVRIRALAKNRWEALKARCAGRVDSVVALLAGKLPDVVMEAVTCPKAGLFPAPAEIELSCSCPDWAKMCKHVAAALYGIGTRLDAEPELLFVLRGVTSSELVRKAADEMAAAAAAASVAPELAGEDLGALFGIDLAAEGAAEPGLPPTKKARVKSRRAPATAAAKKGSKGAAKARTAPAKKKKKKASKRGRSVRS